MSTIPISVDQASVPQSDTLGVLTSSIRIEPVDAEKVRQSPTHLSEQIAILLQDTKQVGTFQLKEVPLQVGITAEDGVALIDLAKAGVTGTIILTFSV